MERKGVNRIVIVGVLTVWALFGGLSASAHEDQGFDSRNPVCFKSFPTDPALFNETVRPFVNQIIEKHGEEEWTAVLLTNEMHRHLGLWSIIGAKMGVRAREVLDASFDHLQVISFAGTRPPFSCVNDGIQVSTGASLGRGTISNTLLGKPEALFVYNGTRLFMKAKPGVMAEIKKIIKNLSQKHGFQSPEYFKALDKVSVQYWLN